MHVEFHTRGHKVDHWVFEPSFPSFILPYHLKPTWVFETMGFNVFFDSIYLHRYLRLGRYLDIIMWLFLGDALIAFGSFLVAILDDSRLPFVIGGCRDLDRFLDMSY